MKTWLVCSPVYEVTIPIPGMFGDGPKEEVRDCVYVEAETPKDAKVFGVRLMRQEFGWHHIYNDEHPFKGLLVESMEDEEVA